MGRRKIVAIIENKTIIPGVIDGETPKKANSSNRNVWMPVFAGMTRCVGGNSH